MDHIRKAILKAKAAQRDRQRATVAGAPHPTIASELDQTPAGDLHFGFSRPHLELNPQLLETNRIVAHLPHTPISISFDVLRTQVYQIMRERGWQTLVVTSPTPGCGKTVTAINLAISLARQPRCFAVLVDCDFRRPNISEYLGYSPDPDLCDVLSARCTAAEGLQGLTITGPGLGVLATRQSVPRPSEVLSSTPMREVVSSIKAISPETIAIFDLPPMLIADDVIAFLPQVDGVLLMVTPGETSYGDTEACLRNIPEEKLIGTVFTKFEDASEQQNYASYYRP